jgi:hypothetical protein
MERRQRRREAEETEGREERKKGGKEERKNGGRGVIKFS